MFGGANLIDAELRKHQGLLKDRWADLEKAKRSVIDLQDACARLEQKVAQLERDAKALDRGYIALMCDNAASAT